MKYLFILLLLFSTPSVAASDLLTFKTQKELDRYLALIQQVRCVVCQGQAIADSNAPLANDLRKKIALLIEDNQSDAAIKAYLVKRYGEFILYQPRFSKQTLVLWGFPFAAVVAGIIIVYRKFTYHIL